MTKEEYKIKLESLYKEFDTSKRNLMREYALSNNPYSVGDTVTDHIGSGKVEKIVIYCQESNPCCVYECLELKKDGTPVKKLTKRSVFQSNIEQ